MKKDVFRKGLVLAMMCLFIGAGVAPSIIGDTLTSSKTIYVDDDNIQGPWYGTIKHPYQCIQDGVDAASGGDTVYVYNGTYCVCNELNSIVVNKPLNLIGQNREKTIIKGNDLSNVIRVVSSCVNITNFTVRDGIRYQASREFGGIKIIGEIRDINISNNIIEWNSEGITTVEGYGSVGPNNVSIYKNIIRNNDYNGILLRSSGNTIRCNEIYHNGREPAEGKNPDGDGIDIWDSRNNNIIDKNIIYENAVDGIWLDQADNTTISNNIIYKNNFTGIHFGNDEGNKNGDIYDFCAYNKVTGNNIYNNGYGLGMNNLGGGILIFCSRNNLFWNNTIERNSWYGFKILYEADFECDSDNCCKDNKIWHNNFIDNGIFYLLWCKTETFDDENFEASWHIKKLLTSFISASDKNLREDQPRFNKWYNREPNENDGHGDYVSVEYGGNYWSDYDYRYDNPSEHRDKYGILTRDYWICIQNCVLFGETLKQLNLLDDCFYAPINSCENENLRNFDTCPFYKKNGWHPYEPSPPTLEMKLDNRWIGREDQDWTVDHDSEIAFRVSSVDLNDDPMEFCFDWYGNGTSCENNWEGKNTNSGIWYEKNNKWKEGSYTIKVKARDDPNRDGLYDDGTESSWEEYPIYVE